MVRTGITERQAPWQPGGPGEDSYFPPADWHLLQVNDDKKTKKNPAGLLSIEIKEAHSLGPLPGTRIAHW